MMRELMMNDQKTLNAILRQELSAFIQRVFATVVPGKRYVHNWHIDAIAWELMRIMRGENNRLIITLPPRSLKSISASVAFPAWLLGLDPTYRIICVSYAQELALKHSLDTRAVLESPWYKRCFPGTIIHPDKNSQAEFMTTQRGGRYSTSVGGSLTGRGGNLIIIDDPHKADEALSDSKRNTVIDWYGNTLFSRLDNKQNDAIILIQQRLHENDLAGYLLETGNWTHLNLPAIAEYFESIQISADAFHQRNVGDALHPTWESQAVLKALQAELGSFAFAAQYQQRPVPIEGGLVKWDWFQTYSEIPNQKESDCQIIQSWDTASKAEEMHDWSACTTWLIHDKQYYLLDVYRKRLEFPDLKRQIVTQANKWSTRSVLIEDKAAGIQLIQDLNREHRELNIIPIVPNHDKVTRLMGMTPAIEASRVSLPNEAHWLADFRSEILHFPKGKHDDQVDSLSQFLEWAENHCRSVVSADDIMILGESKVLKEFPLGADYPPPWDW
jgi:predicted phage terminase large subunit-like protein